jgi:hypothetical protein
MGYKVGTSRLMSKYMDDNLVDIVDYPDCVNKFPYHVQAKSVTGYPRYNDIFSEFKLTDKPLIIIHEFTEKRGKIFKKIDEFVIMKKEDFYEMLKNK